MSRFGNIGKRVKETIANVDYRKFIGCAPYQVIMVNPTKKEIENCNSIWGTDFDVPDQEPVYLTELSEQDVERLSKNNPNVKVGSTIKEISFSFYCRTVTKLIPEQIKKCDIITFKVRNVVAATTDKIQVIDAYGLSAWGTNEEITNHKIPQYATGPATIDSNYVPALSGEFNLINFFKKILLIPSAIEWNEMRQAGLCSEEQRSQCIWYIDESDWKQIFETGIIPEDLKNSIKNVREKNVIWIPTVIKTIINKETGSSSEISILKTDLTESMFTNNIRNNKIRSKTIQTIVKNAAVTIERENRNKIERDLPADEMFEPCVLKEFKHVPTSETTDDFANTNEFNDKILDSDNKPVDEKDLPF